MSRYFCRPKCVYGLAWCTYIAPVERETNQPNSLNKYQIKVGFSHFHGIWDKHICTISNRCCEVIWF